MHCEPRRSARCPARRRRADVTGSCALVLLILLDQAPEIVEDAAKRYGGDMVRALDRPVADPSTICPSACRSSPGLDLARHLRSGAIETPSWATKAVRT